MQRVILGRTGLSVSVMGLGGGGDSRLGVKSDEAASIRLIRTALDHGVNFIDTAEAYGTEDVVGRGIQGALRSQVVISTKKTTTAGSRPIEPRDVAASLEASLTRLGTDYVDVYHLHGVTAEEYPALRDRVLPALTKLREQGKIRFIGITEKFVADPQHQMLSLALQDDPWDVVMVGFNVLNQSARERVFPHTLARDVGTLIMFAVRRALSRPERLGELLRDLEQRGKISAEAARVGLEFLVHADGAESIPDAAYRYCRYEPGAHVVLVGTSNPAHLLQNIASLARPDLPASDRARLAELFGAVDDVSGH
jgi:aryl-alcohol dehydrogenase-like predicted oxidoreductase